MVKLEVSLWGNEQVQPQAWPPGGLPSAGRGFACGRRAPPAPRDCSASPLPACFPCRHSFVFSLISPHPHLLPSSKKIKGKKEEREEGRSWRRTPHSLQWEAASLSAPCAQAASAGHAVTGVNLPGGRHHATGQACGRAEPLAKAARESQGPPWRPQPASYTCYCWHRFHMQCSVWSRLWSPLLKIFDSCYIKSQNQKAKWELFAKT